MPHPASVFQLPRVFAHRCGGALAPENTLAGLRIAARLGVRAVEFDVTLSADGTPWLIHDETLERTTDGRACVAESSDLALTRVDAGCRHHPAFAGERLPRFADAAKLCRALGLFANVEIKPAPGAEVLTGEVVARAVGEWWPEWSEWRGDSPPPLLSSFSASALAAARRVAPDARLGCLWQKPPADWRRQCAELRAYSVHCAASAASDEFLAEAAAAGLPVLCYTVNDVAQAESLWRRGVAAVFTDRPDLLLADDCR